MGAHRRLTQQRRSVRSRRVRRSTRRSRSRRRCRALRFRDRSLQTVSPTPCKSPAVSAHLSPSSPQIRQTAESGPCVLSTCCLFWWFNLTKMADLQPTPMEIFRGLQSPARKFWRWRVAERPLQAQWGAVGSIGMAYRGSSAESHPRSELIIIHWTRALINLDRTQRRFSTTYIQNNIMKAHPPSPP